ncbi:unnamed protein product, partial [Boreogadus saida]
ELDDSIQSELDQLSRLDPVDSSSLASLSQEVASHRASLDQLRQQVRKSEAAARALDRFLMSLRSVEQDVAGVQSAAPCGDPALLQESRARLALSRQSVGSLRGKAPQLDVLLQGARLVVARDGAPASCLDMVLVLQERLEEADRQVSGRQRSLHREAESRSLGLRGRSLLGEMRRLSEAAEKQGLREPNVPAVQHRLRALSDLEVQLKTQRSELQTLTDLHGEGGGAEEQLQPLKAQWEETQAAVTDRLEECNTLMDLLKKFQGCRGYVSSTMQKAEQVMGEQASYMGKDNLQRLIAKVHDVQEDLRGVGVRMEEVRVVSRQLTAHLKRMPDCSEAPFEGESDALMDGWLDVTEKSESYMDNLQVALEQWERQLGLGAEVEAWAAAKLAVFAESHPFNSEQQVLDMRDEIQSHEENIERFHKKSVEIQEMLQSQDPPLELQVVETQQRKRMEQVQELFSDSTDVFEELVAVKKHLAEKIQECAAALENIQTSVNNVSTSEPRANTLLQDLSEDLDFQEEKAQGVVRELDLISSVASPEALEPLTQDASRLKHAFSLGRELIQRRRDDQGKDLATAIRDDNQRFDEFFQDLQLSINECFENPECREDVETSLNRLTGFLEARESERRLAQLRERLEGGREQIPPPVLEELTSWLEEQQKEVSTFATHCSNRQQQMQSTLNTFKSLQEQYDAFQQWLKNKEKDSVESDQVSRLLKDLQDQRGSAESLEELLAAVRRHGVRADGLLKDGDDLLQRYRHLETRLGGRQSQARRELEGQREEFHTRAESTQTWIRDLAEGLASPHIQGQHQEVKLAAQAVLVSRPDGDARVDDLRRRGQSVCEREDPEEGRRREVQQAVEATAERWSSVLQRAEESLRGAEARAAAEESLDGFRSQKESVLSWVRQQAQTLRSVGGHMTFEERLQIPRDILASKPAGDAKLQELREQAGTLCGNEEPEESVRRRRQEVQQSLREVETQWAGVLRGAGEAERSALSEDFHLQKNRTLAWVAERQRALDALGRHAPAEQRRRGAEDVLGSRPEGDRQVNNLRRGGQGLCGRLEWEEDRTRREEVQQAVKEAEERWRLVLTGATQSLEEAEAQVALETEKRDGELREFNTQNQEATVWIGALQGKLTTLAEQTNAEDRLHSAQAVLGSKPEGDGKVDDLRRRGQSVCEREDLTESGREEVQQAAGETAERWRSVLEKAEEVLRGAELQSSLSRELQAFSGRAESAGAWLKELRHQAAPLETLVSRGSQEQIESRLQAAQAILGSRSRAKGFLSDLSRGAQSLSQREDLEESRRTEVQQTVRQTEEQWRSLLKTAEGAQRELKAVTDLVASCELQRRQARGRLAELQRQSSALPRLFPWPGLGDRREAAEDVRALLERTRDQGPVLKALRRQAEEVFETTQDPTWRDPTWAGMEECLPGLLSELTEAGADLELGVLTERQFTQLVEQHGAAQDWLREQVKVLGPPPADRQGLHGAANTLKALLQTVGREEREMKELDALRDRLTALCTPGGRDSLSLEVRHLHELRTTSEQEVRERLAVCEARLGELGQEAGRRGRALKERGAALQWELRSLDQALCYSEPQNHIAQLQQHWTSLQKCQGSLEGLGVKVQELYQEVKSVAGTTEEMPSEAITMVESLKQQNDDLRSRLKERQDSCTKHTSCCSSDCLRALQQWNLTQPSTDSPTSVKAALEEGEKLQHSLREALSHRQFLVASLKGGEAERLERESSEALQAAVTKSSTLTQSLKGLEDKKKHKLQAPQAAEVRPARVEDVEIPATAPSVVAPPRTIRPSADRKSISVSQKHTELQEPIIDKDKRETTRSEIETSVSVVRVTTETTYVTEDRTLTASEATSVSVLSAEPATEAGSEGTRSTKSTTTSSSVEPVIVRAEPHFPVIVWEPVDTAVGGTDKSEQARRQDLDVVAQPALPECMQTKEEFLITTSGLAICQTNIAVKEPQQFLVTRSNQSLAVSKDPSQALNREPKESREDSTEGFKIKSETITDAQTQLVTSWSKLETSVSSGTLDAEPKGTEHVQSTQKLKAEQAKPSPPTRKSKSTKTSDPIKTDTNEPITLEQAEVKTTAHQAQASVTTPVPLKPEQDPINAESEKSSIIPYSTPALSETAVMEKAMVVPARKKSKSSASPTMRATPAQSKQDSESNRSSVSVVDRALPVPTKKVQSPRVDTTAKQLTKTTITTTKEKTEKTKHDLSRVETSKNQDSSQVGTAKVDVCVSHLVPSRRRSRKTPEGSTASEPASDVAIPADVPTKLAESETTTDDQTKLVPTRRKSKTSVTSMKLEGEPQQKITISKPGMQTRTLEQAKPSPTTRRSKSTKTSEPIKTDTMNKDVISVQTEQDPANVSLINPESVYRPSIAPDVEKTTLELTGTLGNTTVSTTLESTSPVTGPAEAKIKPIQTKTESAKSPITAESITGLAETGVVLEEPVVVPPRRKLKCEGSPKTQADVKPPQSTEDSESPQPSPIGEELAALSNSQSATVHEIAEPHSEKKVALVVLDIPAFQTADNCQKTSISERGDSAGSIGVDITLGHASKKLEPTVLPQPSQSHINVPPTLLPEKQTDTDVPEPQSPDQTSALRAKASVTAPVPVKPEQVQANPESEKSPIIPYSTPALLEPAAMVVPARKKSKSAESPIMRSKPALSKQDSETPLSSVSVVDRALPVPTKKVQSPRVDTKTAKEPTKTTITTTKLKTEKTKQDLSSVETSKDKDSTPVGTAKVEFCDSHIVPRNRKSRKNPEDSTASEPASNVAAPADVPTKLAESETTADEQTKFVPTRRKSKTIVTSMKLDGEPQQKIARAKPAMETRTLEQAKPSPATRRSKLTKTSEPIKTETMDKEFITVRTEQDLARLTSFNPELVIRPSKATVVEETSLKRTDNKDNQKVSTTSEPTSLVTGPAEVKIESCPTKDKSVRSSFTAESITGLAETGAVVEESIVVPPRRKLKPDGPPMTQADVKPAQSTGDSESPQPSPHSEEQAALCSSQSSTVHEIIAPHSVKKVAVVVLDIPVFQTVEICPQTSSSEKADSAGSKGVDIPLGQASKESEPSVLPQRPQSEIVVPQSLIPERQQQDVPKPEPKDQTTSHQELASVTAPVAVKTKDFRQNLEFQ